MASSREQLDTGADCWSMLGQVQVDPVSPSQSGQMSARELSEQRLQQLTRTIESEIIPRLLMAHRVSPPITVSAATNGRTITQDDVYEFARLVLVHDQAVAAQYVEALRAEGAALETIFLDLFTPTARMLGKNWEDDLNDFTEVTVGLSHLQQLLRDLSASFEHETDDYARSGRALLVPARGEQHSFGLFMVEEFFRRGGWDVWAGLTMSQNKLNEIVKRDWFDMIGFSASCDHLLDEFASDIKAVRRESRNRNIFVMVGGPAFIDHPERVKLVGADATATDGREAVNKAAAFRARKAAR